MHPVGRRAGTPGGVRGAECSPICRAHSGLVPLSTSIYLSIYPRTAHVTNKQKNRPKARTDARDSRARKQTNVQVYLGKRPAVTVTPLLVDLWVIDPGKRSDLGFSGALNPMSVSRFRDDVSVTWQVLGFA